MTNPTAIAPLAISDWVKNLAGIPEREFSIANVHDYLQTYPIDAASLAKYCFFSKGNYTRNLIFKNDLFECMTVCWEVGQASRIHNHRDQNCWMAVPIGRLKVQNYRVDDRDAQCSTCHLVPTRVFEMSPAHPGYVDPLEPVHGSLASADRFRAAVQEAKIGPDNDIPHVSAPTILKYVTDLQLVGLL